MEEHILDLSKRQWSHSRYGLTIIGTWVKIDHRWRPCMAVIRDLATSPPCVIPLEKAWQWSDVIGEPDVHAIAMLVRLGVDPTNIDNRNKLISLVNSRMAELVEMPPRPPEAEHHADPLADVTLTNSATGTTEVSL